MTVPPPTRKKRLQPLAILLLGPRLGGADLEERLYHFSRTKLHDKSSRQSRSRPHVSRDQAAGVHIGCAPRTVNSMTTFVLGRLQSGGSPSTILRSCCHPGLLTPSMPHDAYSLWSVHHVNREVGGAVTGLVQKHAQPLKCISPIPARYHEALTNLTTPKSYHREQPG